MLKRLDRFRRRRGGASRKDISVQRSASEERRPFHKEVTATSRSRSAPLKERVGVSPRGKDELRAKRAPDAPTTIPVAAAPAFQPVPGIQLRPPPMVVMPAPPDGLPLPGPSSAFFDELLSLLRESRRAQSALIDQQRETLRYMRGLDKWLNESGRERDDDMRRLTASIDDLRRDLGVTAGGAQPYSVAARPTQPRGRRARRRD